jgi:hypothetical protein
MSLRSITAKFECDGCGKEIVVRMDPATENIPNGMDWAESELKDNLSETVQEGMHLCGTCTRIADNIHEDVEKQPTRDEIEAAIREQSG